MMRRLVRFVSFAAVLSIVLSGCGKDQNTNTNIDEGAAGGSISVHVSDGDSLSKPIYTWSYLLPDGSSDTSAMKLKVARVSDLNTPVWEVQSSAAQDNIQNPVIHGTVPSNAGPVVETETDLQTNVDYRVTVSKVPPGPTGYREFLIKP